MRAAIRSPSCTAPDSAMPLFCPVLRSLHFFPAMRLPPQSRVRLRLYGEADKVSLSSLGHLDLLRTEGLRLHGNDSSTWARRGPDQDERMVWSELFTTVSCARLPGQKSELPGPGQGLELGLGAQALQERADVVAHRRLREVELGTDVPGALARGEQLQHLELPARKRGDVPTYGATLIGAGLLGGQPDQAASHLQGLVRFLHIPHEVDQVWSTLGVHDQGAQVDPPPAAGAGQHAHVVAGHGLADLGKFHRRAHAGIEAVPGSSLGRYDLVAGPANHLLGQKACEGLRPGVPVDEAVFGVHHEDGVCRASPDQTFYRRGKFRGLVTRLVPGGQGELHTRPFVRGLPYEAHDLLPRYSRHGQRGPSFSGRNARKSVGKIAYASTMIFFWSRSFVGKLWRRKPSTGRISSCVGRTSGCVNHVWSSVREQERRAHFPDAPRVPGGLPHPARPDAGRDHGARRRRQDHFLESRR